MVFETILSRGVEPARWLIVAGIAYTLATSIWSFFETPVSTTVKAPTEARITIQRAPANVNWILTKNLFGEAGAAPPADSNSDEPAVQTRLPLELQSVFVADDGEQSAAIIAQRGKPGLLYHLGDKLPGNAKLVDVKTDRIILQRAGVRETLMFPQSKSTLVAAASDVVAVKRTDGSKRSPQANDRGDQNSQPASQGEVLQTYRDKLAVDAAGTLDELGIETVDASSTGGYRIGDVAQSPYLRQTGLQSGDVILSVNGRPVGDIQQDQLELENIMAQGSARIEIQRGSRRFFITASLN